VKTAFVTIRPAVSASNKVEPLFEATHVGYGDRRERDGARIDDNDVDAAKTLRMKEMLNDQAEKPAPGIEPGQLPEGSWYPKGSRFRGEAAGAKLAA
jgi:hypothetical protein